MGQHHPALCKAQFQRRAAWLFGKVQPACQVARLHHVARAAAPVQKARGAGEQVIFVESSSSTMLEAEDSRPSGHLAQVRTAEQASVACTSSGRTPTTAMEALK